MTTLYLVDMDQAAYQLQIEIDAHVSWLADAIADVSEAVRSYLKEDWRLYVPLRDSDGKILRDPDGNPMPSTTVNPIVRRAVLLELASQFRFREGEGDNRGRPDEYGYALSRGASAMLATLRCPTVR